MKLSRLTQAGWMMMGLLAMTGAAISASSADLPQGLVVYLNFDATDSGGVSTDLTSQRNNGKVVGAKWTATGKQGGGYEFSSTNSYIQVASSASLNVKQTTISLWFKTSKSDAVWRRLVDKRLDRGFALCIAGDSKDGKNKGKLAFGVADRNWCFSDSAVADGAWHHAAVTVDGTSLKMYLDGQLQKQVTPFKGDLPANESDLTIGLNRSNPSTAEKGQSFEGAIDEVMIFNRALPETEAKALFTTQNTVKPKFTKEQVARRLVELKELLDRGLVTKDFYERKVKECETEAAK